MNTAVFLISRKPPAAIALAAPSTRVDAVPARAGDDVLAPPGEGEEWVGKVVGIFHADEDGRIVAEVRASRAIRAGEEICIAVSSLTHCPLQTCCIA